MCSFKELLLMMLLKSSCTYALAEEVCSPCFKMNLLSPRENSHLAGISASDSGLLVACCV